MKKVKYKPVKNYEGFYEVSATGIVRSLDRRIIIKGNKNRRIKGKVLSPKCNGDGYLFVTLSKEGSAKTCYVHRLVADAFIPNPRRLGEVNHKNGVKSDNTLDNLEWISHAGNVQHAYDNHLNKNQGGGHFYACGVIDNELDMEFETVKEWCDYKGINYSTGRNILNGSNKSKVIDLTRITKTTKSNG